MGNQQPVTKIEYVNVKEKPNMQDFAKKRTNLLKKYPNGLGYELEPFKQL